MNLLHFWQQGDAVTHTVAWLLLAMSLASWYLIFSRSWFLRRAQSQAQPAQDQFWAAPTWADGVNQLTLRDSAGLFAPLAQAAWAAQATPASSLAAHTPYAERIIRALRSSLQQAQRRLEAGQVILATVGSTAPFVGLFGTVWGIYHALSNIVSNGQLAIEKVAGPVGEALIMTAFGLVVAIPAVVAYNLFGQRIRVLTEELEGFAHDVQSTLVEGSAMPSGQ